MGDDPAYLQVGTEVSAKYKGAFCEAKIRKVVRLVKCKVIFKAGGGTKMLTDDQIKGNLRVGGPVEAKHPDKGTYIEGTIGKIQDCSQYTVVFDDGDITTLKRTALVLKSGRHFNESETLDQLPLTHPEHFSNPVVGGRRGVRRKVETISSTENDDESSEEETPPVQNNDNEQEQQLINEPGCVIWVEAVLYKKGKTSWFPALIVKMKKRSKDNFLVRSFADSRFYTVPKKETTPFSTESSFKPDPGSVTPNYKQAVQRAILYIEKKELPPHWDKDMLFGRKPEDGNDSNDDDASSVSDISEEDPKTEDKDSFMTQLNKYMEDKGTPIIKIPVVCNKELDLYKLYKLVDKEGGYNKVTSSNLWKPTTMKMGFGKMPSTSTINLVKQAYKKLLHNYEELQRKPTSSNSSSSVSSQPSTSSVKSRSNRTLARERHASSSSKEASASSKAEETNEKEAEEKDKTPALSISSGDMETDSISIISDSDTKKSEQSDEPRRSRSRQDSRGHRKEIEETGNADAPPPSGKKQKGVKGKDVVREASVSPPALNRKSRNVIGASSKYRKKEKDAEPVSTSTKPEEVESMRDHIDKNVKVQVGDKLKVYYGPKSDGKVTYEAKVVDLDDKKQSYLVHYTGWNVRYDEWIPRVRICENLSLRLEQVISPAQGRGPAPSIDNSAGDSSPASSVKGSKRSRIKKLRPGEQESVPPSVIADSPVKMKASRKRLGSESDSVKKRKSRRMIGQGRSGSESSSDSEDKKDMELESKVAELQPSDIKVPSKTIGTDDNEVAVAEEEPRVSSDIENKATSEITSCGGTTPENRNQIIDLNLIRSEMKGLDNMVKAVSRQNSPPPSQDKEKVDVYEFQDEAEAQDSTHGLKMFSPRSPEKRDGVVVVKGGNESGMVAVTTTGLVSADEILDPAVESAAAITFHAVTETSLSIPPSIMAESDGILDKSSTIIAESSGFLYTKSTQSCPGPLLMAQMQNPPRELKLPEIPKLIESELVDHSGKAKEGVGLDSITTSSESSVSMPVPKPNILVRDPIRDTVGHIPVTQSVLSADPNAKPLEFTLVQQRDYLPQKQKYPIPYAPMDHYSPLPKAPKKEGKATKGKGKLQQPKGNTGALPPNPKLSSKSPTKTIKIKKTGSQSPAKPRTPAKGKTGAMKAGSQMKAGTSGLKSIAPMQLIKGKKEPVIPQFTTTGPVSFGHPPPPPLIPSSNIGIGIPPRETVPLPPVQALPQCFMPILTQRPMGQIVVTSNAPLILPSTPSLVLQPSFTPIVLSSSNEKQLIAGTIMTTTTGKGSEGIPRFGHLSTTNPIVSDNKPLYSLSLAQCIGPGGIIRPAQLPDQTKQLQQQGPIQFSSRVPIGDAGPTTPPRKKQKKAISKKFVESESESSDEKGVLKKTTWRSPEDSLLLQNSLIRPRPPPGPITLDDKGPSSSLYSSGVLVGSSPLPKTQKNLGIDSTGGASKRKLNEGQKILPKPKVNVPLGPIPASPVKVIKPKRPNAKKTPPSTNLVPNQKTLQIFCETSGSKGESAAIREPSIPSTHPITISGTPYVPPVRFTISNPQNVVGGKEAGQSSRHPLSLGIPMYGPIKPSQTQSGIFKEFGKGEPPKLEQKEGLSTKQGEERWMVQPSTINAVPPTVSFQLQESVTPCPAVIIKEPNELGLPKIDIPAMKEKDESCNSLFCEEEIPGSPPPDEKSSSRTFTLPTSGPSSPKSTPPTTKASVKLGVKDTTSVLTCSEEMDSEPETSLNISSTTKFEGVSKSGTVPEAGKVEANESLTDDRGKYEESNIPEHLSPGSTSSDSPNEDGGRTSPQLIIDENNGSGKSKDPSDTESLDGNTTKPEDMEEASSPGDSGSKSQRADAPASIRKSKSTDTKKPGSLSPPIKRRRMTRKKSPDEMIMRPYTSRGGRLCTSRRPMDYDGGRPVPIFNLDKRPKTDIVDFLPNLDGVEDYEESIAIILDKMQEMREATAIRRAEIAAIDKRKKRHKKKEREREKEKGKSNVKKTA